LKKISYFDPQIESIDGKGENPKPSGKFYLSKDNARKAAVEVLSTHFGLKGAEGEKFLGLRYEDAWNYYDVNKTGMIDAVEVKNFNSRVLRLECLNSSDT